MSSQRQVVEGEAPAFDPFPGSSFQGAGPRNLAALSLLDSLFVYSRLAVSVLSWQSALLLLYAPIGALIVAFRVLVGFPITCLISVLPLPRWMHTRIFRYELLLFYGIYVRVIGEPAEGARIFTPNHISEFDAVAIRAVLDPVIFAYSIYENMWWLKCTPIHIFQMEFVPPVSRMEGNALGRDIINSKINDLLQNTSRTLLVFPEGGLTNTPSGLMQYHKHTFGLGVKMQPIALKYWSPLPLHADTAYASFVNNVLCMLLNPYQAYTIQFLPAMQGLDGESGLSFSRRVMATTAHKLNMLATPFLYSDKKKWLQLRRRMMEDGYWFEFKIDMESETVEIINLKELRKGSKSKVVPAEATDNKAIIDKYLREQWGIDSNNFSHLVFSPGSDYFGAPVEERV